MARVRFTSDFDFSPSAFGGRVTQAFLAGTETTVTSECAEAALAAGKAVKAKTPRKGDSDEAP